MPQAVMLRHLVTVAAGHAMPGSTAGQRFRRTPAPAPTGHALHRVTPGLMRLGNGEGFAPGKSGNKSGPAMPQASPPGHSANGSRHARPCRKVTIQADTGTSSNRSRLALGHTGTSAGGSASPPGHCGNGSNHARQHRRATIQANTGTNSNGSRLAPGHTGIDAARQCRRW